MVTGAEAMDRVGTPFSEVAPWRIASGPFLSPGQDRVDSLSVVRSNEGWLTTVLVVTPT